MDYLSIERAIYKYKGEGKKLFTTSSFQTHSLVMLHILSRIDPTIPVVFMNTGFHFPDTLKFRDYITERFGLTIVDLRSNTPRLSQRGPDGRFFFASDPDYCCYLNKTKPLESWLMKYDIWINGVRADQSATRKSMKSEMNAPHGTMRFHPMLDWSSKEIYEYRKKYDLPENPLEAKGYISIGCEPCTVHMDPSMSDREARWFGLNKTECGLHTDLVDNDMVEKNGKSKI
jgi:phosphoadenosine phosphosulfate reductase